MPEVVEGQFIATTGKTLGEFRAALGRGGYRHLEVLPFGYHLVEDEQRRANGPALNGLVLAGAKRVQPNFVKRIALSVEPSAIVADQWALENPSGADIRAVPAWQYLRSVPGADRKVQVAVIDSGIDMQSAEFTGRIDLAKSYNFISGDRNLQDYHGHGTHVAGIIGASHAPGSRIRGVNPNVEFVILKAFTMYGFATSGSILKSLNAALNANVKVINASYGSTRFDQAEFDALKKIRAAGILFVAAAGNDGVDTDQKEYYPSGYDLPNIVSVGASTRVDEPAKFSNFGVKTVDVFAPGAEILSTIVDVTFRNRKQVFALDMNDTRANEWKESQATNVGLAAPSGWSHTSCGDTAGACLSFKPAGGYSPSAKFDFFNLLYTKQTVKSDPEKRYAMIAHMKYVFPKVDWSQEVTGSVMAGGISSWMLPAYYQRGETGWVDREVDLSEPGLFYSGTTAWEQIHLGFSVNFSKMAGADYKKTEMAIRKFTIVNEEPVTASTLDRWNGTSMATPHVVGIAAWMFAVNPSAKPEQVRAKLIASCDPVAGMKAKASCGGRVNMDGAVR